MLVVDDVTDNIRMLIEILKDDYAIIPATNGKVAIEKATASANDLEVVLLDILMPEMDGYEVCKKFKEDPKLSHIPIIFITAMSEAMDNARAFDVGGVDYITKPFNPATVKARVKSHIQYQRTVYELQDALKKVKLLSNLLPICSNCKKIRDDKGYWKQVEDYLAKHSEVRFTHSICPECCEELYPEFYKKNNDAAPGDIMKT